MKILHVEMFGPLRTLTSEFLSRVFPGVEVVSIGTEESFLLQKGDLIKIPFTLGLFTANLLWKEPKAPAVLPMPRAVSSEAYNPLAPRVGGLRCLDFIQSERSKRGLPPLPHFFFDTPSQRVREAYGIDDHQIVEPFDNGEFRAHALEEKVRDMLDLQVAA